MRYNIKYGKYGAYFYDTVEEQDLTLNEVRDRLNEIFPDAQGFTFKNLGTIKRTREGEKDEIQ